MRSFFLSGVRCMLTCFLVLTGLESVVHAENSPIRILFLGDQNHHFPAQRWKVIEPVLKEAGIEGTYTENHNIWTDPKLSQYDAILIYHNVNELSPKQEAGLLRYVEQGGGLIPVHCASACYGNSDAYIDLVGGRFKSHGAEEFQSKIVDAQHQAMQGLKSFTTWDETYVHSRLAHDNRVLMVRPDGDRYEPYTWVRERGKGKIFYTALGHDFRTWEHPGFQKLLINGIKWATGRLTSDLPPVPKIPSAQPARETEIPVPLSPEESMRRMHLPEGFRVELFASEPDIVKPIAMAFDARGRLWVAESIDYPNWVLTEEEGNDRIKICEDTDGDGKADKFTVFADGLNIPTGLQFADGGVVVACAPDILFLKDTDGDDRADERQVLFTGFLKGDTHAIHSNLTLGLDNWIWATIGYTGAKIPLGDKEIDLRLGMFRFKPDGSDLEKITTTSNNTWGLGMSEEGNWFASTANNEHSVHMGVPTRYYDAVHGWHGNGSAGIADSEYFHAIAKYRQWDHHGKFTAASGHNLYTARQFPKEYWNRTAFICAPTGHLIKTGLLEQQGSHFRTNDGFNLMASEDEWTAPIYAYVGPDGAVWFVDWYNYIVQHNPTPQGFENGMGNAYITPMRDKTHGRIYRIVYEGEGADPVQPINRNLEAASSKELVGTLNDKSQVWRMHAQRLLVERGDRSILSDLRDLVEDESLDGIGLNVGAIHALRALDGLEASEEEEMLPLLTKALHHPSPGVRQNALEVLPPSERAVEAILSSGVLEDEDLLVRKAALLSLAEMSASKKAGKKVYEMLQVKENAEDRWIPEAAIAAAARHDKGFLEAALANQTKLGDEAEAETPPENLIADPSFEAAKGGGPSGWKEVTYSGEAEFAVSSQSRTGSQSLQITSTQGADAGWYTEIEVDPHSTYRLSGWIRTEGVQNSGRGKGALLNVHNLQQFKTEAVVGDSDWAEVDVTIETGGATKVGINCLFGGWGQSTGTAWFDDIRLERLSAHKSSQIDRAVEVVTAHYAHRGPKDSILKILKRVSKTSDEVSRAILSGFARGWPSGQAPDVGREEIESISQMLESICLESQVSLFGLLGNWEVMDPFVPQLDRLNGNLESNLSNTDLRDEDRIRFAELLIQISDSPKSIEAITKTISTAESPEYVCGVLRAIATSHLSETGKAILSVWPDLGPSAQAVALDSLLRRSDWTALLVDAFEEGKVQPTLLSLVQRNFLTENENTEIARRAKEIYASNLSSETSEQRSAVMEKILAMAPGSGDLDHGKAVFENNCALCHTLDGTGGELGPDLTGIGANERSAILMDILDPNRSVEGVYFQWHVTDSDDFTCSGRLLNETASAVEILEPNGDRKIIPRDEIIDLRMSSLSVMPEGFDLLPEEELISLLDYLKTRVVGATE